jgi:U4/U6.U5 tri-snRNP-associated protein 3
MGHKSRSRSRSKSRERSSKHHKSHKHQKKTSNRKRSRSRSPLQSTSSTSRVRSRSPRRRSRSPKYRSSGTSRNVSPPSTSLSVPKGTTLIDNTTLGGSKRVDYLTLGNIKPKLNAQVPVVPILDPAALEGKSQDEVEMMKLLGFSSFDSTKGKHVDGACNAGMSNIQQKRRYRQYMNRKGGFNRPLDPVV